MMASTWGSCQKFFKKLCSTPGYVSPEAYNGTGPIQWETPIPFDDFNLPEFPTDTLPPAVRDYVEAVAETTQASVDMAAVASLAILSICLQGKYRIWGKSPSEIAWRLARYQFNLAILDTMLHKGELSETDHATACGVLACHYGLDKDSIFR